MLEKIEKNYKIERDPRSPWTVYHLNGTPRAQENTGFKIHVSFDSRELYTTSLNLLRILSEHSIHTFKLLENKQGFEDDRNLQGKELVIYPREEFDKENDPKFWAGVLTKLENCLNGMEIDPNPKFTPQGDQLLPGSKGYTYFRCVENIFGNYVSADSLHARGFTNTEGFNLSGSTVFANWLLGLTLHSETDTNNLVNENNASSTFVMPTISTNLGQFDKSQIRSDLLYSVIEGEAEKIYLKNEKYNKICRYDKEIKKLELILYNLSHAYLHNGNTDGDPVAKFIYDCLDQASEYIAMIRRSMGMQISYSLRLCIVPAFYFQCIVPLATALKQNKSCEPKKLIKELINEDTFIRAIVKCSFREKKKQFDSKEALYLNGLDEQSLDVLIQKAINLKKQSLSSLSSTSVSTNGFFASNQANASKEIPQYVSFSEIWDKWDEVDNKVVQTSTTGVPTNSFFASNSSNATPKEISPLAPLYESTKFWDELDKIVSNISQGPG